MPGVLSDLPNHQLPLGAIQNTPECCLMTEEYDMGNMGNQIEQSEVGYLAQRSRSMSGVGRLAMNTVKMGSSPDWAMRLGLVVRM